MQSTKEIPNEKETDKRVIFIIDLKNINNY
jgi:hypothetical protein